MTFQSILPRIFVASEDDARLRELASPLAKRGSWIASFLLSELERSIPCGSCDLPEDTVTMGSRVDYRIGDDGEVVSGVLVYPEEYMPRRGLTSVLTPEGAALFGLRAGSSMRYQPPLGPERTITVVRVQQALASNVLPFRPRAVPSGFRGFDPEPDGAA